VPVRLDKVRLERGRQFGDVWLGWTLWRALELDTFCEARMPRGRELVPWATMAAILVIARLCEPSSELHIAESWYRRTALEDLLGVPAELVNDDRLYRALDHLVEHRYELQQHLVKRLGELFSLDYELLLYDVTSTYFEGQAARNPMAKRGHSRDHRPDCKQVCIALVVTREGIPLGYEVFDGNRVDVTTVEDIVGTMEERYGKARRIWVMDRGMSSANNVQWLQQTGRRYLIGASKQELKKFAGALADASDWNLVREGVEAKLCPGPDGTETFVLVRSADRRDKEHAMHERFARHIEEGLTRLGRRIDASRKPLDRSTVDRQIGRLLGKNSRAAGRYQVRLVDDASRAATFRASNGPHAPIGTTGRATAKAATCSAPTSTTGRPRSCGRRISSSPRPKPLFAFTRASCLCAPSGISLLIACRPTSSFAFSPTCSGRPWSSGRCAPTWAIARALSWTSSAPSRALTSSCPSPRHPNASFAFAASCAPIALRHSSSIASASASQSVSAFPSPTLKCSADQTS
jgi:hypothetical protein